MGITNWGKIIKQLRQESGLTQLELAERSGIKRSHISQIERSKYRSCRRPTIKRLATGLEISQLRLKLLIKE
ncbi:MAG: helix-turn-helix transcriptional regulator [Dehalococcoidales bacterium]|nr:helix-turn-helix transcriptional regulator [Dehalococcoidales bacterium]